MSSGNQFYMGEGYVPAYQLSATPFVTSSNVALGQTKEISFGSVTRFFTVRNGSDGGALESLSVAFTENGLRPGNSNYFVLGPLEQQTMEMRVDRIFVSGSNGPTVLFTIIAGLTDISPSRFLLVTSSNGFLGVG